MDAARDKGLGGVTPFRFACTRCGNCCSGHSGFVWLADGEIERMARAQGATPESFARRFVRTARDPRTGELRSALKESDAAGGRCALLVGKNTCGVYDARPEHCRAFPYWDSVMTDRAAFESARSTCPGIAVGVDDATRERAFAALNGLYERLGDGAPRAACCLAGEAGETTFATALEADYAVAADTQAQGACRFGARRPSACRPHVDGESALRAVREIERAVNYPAAYAPFDELLRAREVPS
jgi:Fe-S-cluster containining protein